MKLTCLRSAVVLAFHGRLVGGPILLRRELAPNLLSLDEVEEAEAALPLLSLLNFADVELESEELVKVGRSSSMSSYFSIGVFSRGGRTTVVLVEAITSRDPSCSVLGIASLGSTMTIW